ncbi:MAG: bifunctional methionine sulfoxide reductase B/A protein [FCB group bacterium]|nr:bifunctional methionine sulfoxide reductase B/A protein [FCB group bacterium]
MLAILVLTLSPLSGDNKMKENQNNKPLTPEEKHVIENKGTETPFSGALLQEKREGVYVCRRCGETLYRSTDKFDSGCGWPSFDDEIPGKIKRVPDADGRRTEIICANCDAHLGHVFLNEGFTPKNTRHCVNSISMEFIPDAERTSAEAIFAGGCFWGVEYFMQQIKGVRSVISGYTGGKTKDPTYPEVSRGNTGHYEAVRIIYDPRIADYETLARTFFEIHDPTQKNGQGPDIGKQYRSAVFYMDAQQKAIAEKCISQLQANGYKVATRLLPASVFYPAEDYHQDYYVRKGTLPYCHSRVRRF